MQICSPLIFINLPVASGQENFRGPEEKDLDTHSVLRIPVVFHGNRVSMTFCNVAVLQL
jgi:hypothetical protein